MENKDLKLQKYEYILSQNITYRYDVNNLHRHGNIAVIGNKIEKIYENVYKSNILNVQGSHIIFEFGNTLSNTLGKKLEKTHNVQYFGYKKNTYFNPLTFIKEELKYTDANELFAELITNFIIDLFYKKEDHIKMLTEAIRTFILLAIHSLNKNDKEITIDMIADMAKNLLDQDNINKAIREKININDPHSAIYISMFQCYIENIQIKALHAITSLDVFKNINIKEKITNITCEYNKLDLTALSEDKNIIFVSLKDNNYIDTLLMSILISQTFSYLYKTNKNQVTIYLPFMEYLLNIPKFAYYMNELPNKNVTIIQPVSSINALAKIYNEDTKKIDNSFMTHIITDVFGPLRINKDQDDITCLSVKDENEFYWSVCPYLEKEIKNIISDNRICIVENHTKLYIDDYIKVTQS